MLSNDEKTSWNDFVSRSNMARKNIDENSLNEYNKSNPKSKLGIHHLTEAMDEIKSIKESGNNDLSYSYRNGDSQLYPVYKDGRHLGELPNSKIIEKRGEEKSEEEDHPVDLNSNEKYKKELSGLEEKRQSEINEAKKFKPSLNLLDKKKLDGRFVNMNVEIEETGEKKMAKIPALQAHNDIVKRFNDLKRKSESES